MTRSFLCLGSPEAAMIAASVLQIILLRVKNGVIPTISAVLPHDAVFPLEAGIAAGIAVLFRYISSSFLFALALTVSKYGAMTGPFSFI